MTKLSNQISGLANRQQNIAARHQAAADKLNEQAGKLEHGAGFRQSKADAFAGKSADVSAQSADLFEQGNKVGGLAGQLMMDKSQEMAEVAANMMGRFEKNAERSGELSQMGEEKSGLADQAQLSANGHSRRAARLHKVSEGLLAQGLRV
jgi:hypothetical protein